MAAFQDSRRILNTHYFKNHQNYEQPAGREWMNLPEIPSPEEICPDAPVSRPRDPIEEEKDWADYQKDPIYDPNLPVNIVDGPWPSKEEYISTHYQILREDAVASLRRSVKEFKKNPSMLDNDSTFIYTQVSFIGYQLARSGAACRICFSTERAEKRINWKSSKRLAQGTIVALMPVNDRSQKQCRIAIVAARPVEGGLDQNPPQIDLFWGDIDQVELDPSQKYSMIEAREGYFEASRHMLVALQILMTEKFQLADHIVHLDRKVKAPSYLEENPYMDLSTLEFPNTLTSGTTLKSLELQNVDVIRDFPGRNLNSSMDDSQLQACEKMLTKSVSIIQGPPGTGKTFVSICALKAMISSLEPGAPPVIVSAQTNHALDQLLNHIMEFNENVLRLGGRSDKENIEIRKRTPYELRQNNKIPGGSFGLNACRRDWERLVEEIQMILAPLRREGLVTSDSLVERGIITEKQRSSLREEGWSNGGLYEDLKKIEQASPIDMNLPMEENEEDEEEKLLERAAMSADVPGPDDNDRDALGGTWVPFNRKLTSRHTGKVVNRTCRKLLEKHDDLYDIKQSERGHLYRYFESQFDNVMLTNFREALRKYEKVVREYQVTKGLCNINLVNHLGIKVIGCTTTGLSKYRAFLSALQPRTLLIEEAAETIEGSIIGGMFDSLQQLTLVGDHLQLQASCNTKHLEEAPYFMKVSMFERLVNNSFEYVMLNHQRRMIPEIRKLLCIEPKPMYKNLYDHRTVQDRVNNRPPIPGMGGVDTFFLHHNWPEARNTDGSCYNIDEAQMIVGFFLYLRLNGVDPSKITVLTFYNGQRKLILHELKNNRGLRGIKFFHVYTVDSYQGEENDVILLSLVRSNNHGGVGFLENRNRVVVALSRARRGLYLFGNIVTLIAQENENDTLGREPLWSSLEKHMIEHGRLGFDDGLPLTCIRHGRTTMVHEPGDWMKEGRAGGCDLKCDLGGLPCGHQCSKRCHPFDHEELICQEPCMELLQCGHGCSRFCGEDCFCDGCAIAKLTSDEDDSNGMGGSSGCPFPSPIALAAPIGGGTPQRAGGYQVPDRTRPNRFMKTLDRPSSSTNHARGGRGNNRGIVPTDSSAWNRWNAQASDARIAHQQQLEDEAIRELDLPPAIIADTYRSVTVRDGERTIGKSILKIYNDNSTITSGRSEKGTVGKSVLKVHNDNPTTSSPQPHSEGSISMNTHIMARSLLDDDQDTAAKHLPVMSPSNGLTRSDPRLITKDHSVAEIANRQSDRMSQNLIDFD